MSVKSWWIPKSERGREVVRTLKVAGFAATYQNTLGRYVCNLFCASELTNETLREIAYDINTELAGDTEQEYYERAEALLDSGYEEEFPGTYERELVAWL